MVSRREQTLSYAILLAFSLIAVWPVLAVVLLAFNPPGTLVSSVGLPVVWSLESFSKAWTEAGVGQSLLNSFIVAISVVVAAIVLSIMTGYAFGTMRFRGMNVLFFYVLVGIIVPYEATVIPLYYDFRLLHLTDTYLAMILPQIAFSVSFGTFWMRAFFRGFPRELIEAARCDGANAWQILWRIIVPTAGPAIMALAAILFIWTWNELLLAIVMIQNPDLQMAPAALAFFAGAQRTQDLPVVAAAAVLVALPVVAIYAILQRRYIEGVVAGAVTGQ
jgi:raffinose/stachyose/melibiose transport system permease protein